MEQRVVYQINCSGRLVLQAELIPVDEQPNHCLVHGNGFSKANDFSHQAFHPHTEGEMLALSQS